MQIVRLVPREAAQRDLRIINGAFDGHEPEVGAGALTFTFAELGRHLQRLEGDYRRGDTDRLSTRSRKIVALSDQGGMRRIAQVAADVALCCQSGDEAALAATLSRLMRLLTRALDENAHPNVPF